MKKILLLAILLPAVALANGYDIPNTSPRDLAMSASVTADQRDAAAAYANPAALSKIEGLSVNASISYLDLRTTWNGPESGPLAGQSVTTKYNPVPPFSAFLAYGFKLADRNAGVGFGANIPGGGVVSYPDTWPGRGRIITVDRKIYGFYLTGGYEVLSQLRFGGGLVYYYGTEYLKQGIQPSDNAYAKLSAKGGSFSFDLAAEYTLPQLPLTFGADFKYKGTMKLSGNAQFVVPGGFLQSQPPPIDQSAKHHLTYPSVLNAGVAYRVIQPLLLTSVVTWTGYSIYGSDIFIGDKGTTISVPRDYKDGWTFRFGGEYKLTESVQLRAGFERDISGLSTDTYSPTLPDASSWSIAFGGGWNIQKDLAVQAAVFRAFLDKVTATGTEAFPGSYKTGVWILSGGLVWRTDLGGGR
jgi:long-chain fatty acid transport protein